MSDIITLTLEELIVIGEKMQGKDRKKWKFTCPVCKHNQSFEDFTKRTDLNDEEIRRQMGFSCIGRSLREKKAYRKKGDDYVWYFRGGGCNWTLGGFLNAHKLEVIEDGKSEPHFELKAM